MVNIITAFLLERITVGFFWFVLHSSFIGVLIFSGIVIPISTACLL